MFEPSITPATANLSTRVSDAARATAQDEAEMLVAIGEIFALQLRQSGECEDYAGDTYDAVAAEVAATLRCSVAMGPAV